MQQAQLDLFDHDTSGHRPETSNPFAHIQGVNLFGQRGLFTGFCDCTGGDLVRFGYAGVAA